MNVLVPVYTVGTGTGTVVSEQYVIVLFYYDMAYYTGDKENIINETQDK